MKAMALTLQYQGCSLHPMKPMTATSLSAKLLKESEVEDAILRQSMACHSDRSREADKRAKR